MKSNLIKLVYSLIALFIIAFLTGFLQDTKFGFIIYISYFILSAVGVKLIAMTLKSRTTKISKAFLFTTGFLSTVYFLSFVYAFINKVLYSTGITESMESIEAILYLNSLLFLIGAIGSIILCKIKLMEK